MLCDTFWIYAKFVFSFRKNSKLFVYENHAIISRFTFCWMDEYNKRSTGSCELFMKSRKVLDRTFLTLIQLSAWTWMISLRNWSFSSHRIIQLRDPISISTSSRLCNYDVPSHPSQPQTFGILFLLTVTWSFMSGNMACTWENERNESKVQWSSDIILLCLYWFFNDH